MASKEDIVRVVQAVVTKHDADVYFYSAPIDERGFGMVATAIGQGKKRNKALLILTTSGGQANAAYQIARLFQNMYEEFAIFAPSYCKSAGTLIVLGAHRLIMDSFSELGPLDVQLLKQNEIMTRKSGLLSKSAFEALGDAAFNLYENLMLKITVASDGVVSFKLASELSATITAGVMRPVYAQLNPDVIGSDHRDQNVALQYGMRLAAEGANATPFTVMRLVEDYPSHDFVIDRGEAMQMFATVDYPSTELYELVGLIGEPAYNESDPPNVIALSAVLEEKKVAGESDATEPAGKVLDSAESQMDGDGATDRPSDPKPTRKKASPNRSISPSKNGAAGTASDDPS